MLENMHLLRPDALWLALLALPLILLLKRIVPAAGSWSKVIDPALLPFMLEGHQQHERRGGQWLIVLGWLLLVLGVAGPSFSKIDVPVFQKADALVLVLDLSASMDATDIQPSRVQRARQKIRDLLAERKEGVTGLVVFAGDTHVVAPLTDDRRTIENLLPALSTDIMPLPGAEAASALRAAAKLLGAAGVANGQILLLTDGMPKFDPEDVLDELQQAGATVNILGIGTAAGAPIPIASGGFMRERDGDIVVPRLDADALKNYAAQLGGRYVNISLDNSDLDTLSGVTLLEDPGQVQLDRKTDTWLDQGNWLALVVALGLLPLFRRGALALLLLMPLLVSDPALAQTPNNPALQAKPVPMSPAAPSATPGEAKSGQAASNETAANSSGFAGLWRTPDQQGAAAMAEGKPAQAAQLFENNAWRGTAHYEAEDWLNAADSFGRDVGADALYNKGNALAKAGEFQRALEAYDASLAEKPQQADALRNRDLVEQLLQQQENEQSKQGDDGDQGEKNEAEPDDQEGSTAGSQGTDSQKQSNNDTDAASPQNNDESNADSAEQTEGGSEGDGDADAGGQQQSGGQSGVEGTSQGQDGLSDAMAEQLQAQTQEQMRKFDAALEEQQALEQWLRRVPDDPGGLLRRKFRYESIQRLRKGEEPDEDVRW